MTSFLYIFSKQIRKFPYPFVQKLLFCFDAVFWRFVMFGEHLRSFFPELLTLHPENVKIIS